MEADVVELVGGELVVGQAAGTGVGDVRGAVEAGEVLAEAAEAVVHRPTGADHELPVAGLEEQELARSQL